MVGRLLVPAQHGDAMMPRQPPPIRSMVELSTIAPCASSVVLVVERHLLLRQGIADFLRDRLPIALQVVGVAPHDQHQLTQMLALQPRLMLVGIGMPAAPGLALIAQLHADLPHAALIAFCWWDGEDYRRSARQAGADAFVCTDVIRTELPDMIVTTMGHPSYRQSAMSRST